MGRGIAISSEDQRLTICLITTLLHNPGDDFVREGIIHLVRECTTDPQFSYIHKHIPSTANPRILRLYTSGFYQRLPRGKLRKLTDRLLGSLKTITRQDSVRNSDILIQCGAPVFWYHGGDRSCRNNEWFDPLVRKRWKNSASSIPFLNLGGGSCQSYFSDGREFMESTETLNYIGEFYDYCRLTTVRDKLSCDILQMTGRKAPLLPCPSLFARFNAGINPHKGEYIALNFMPLGGHFQLTEGVEPENWQRIFRNFARRLAARENCLLVCHSLGELDAAKKQLPQIPRMYSTNHSDYLEAYSRARFGILNRVHGAYALASFGRPSAVFGSDSRARMMGVIGLESQFVGGVSESTLQEALSNCYATEHQYKKHMDALLKEARNQYVDLIRRAVRQ